ncbi:hypothetical protein KC19_5G073500, partial [Ceratodon purpureus]
TLQAAQLVVDCRDCGEGHSEQNLGFKSLIARGRRDTGEGIAPTRVELRQKPEERTTEGQGAAKRSGISIAQRSSHHGNRDFLPAGWRHSTHNPKASLLRFVDLSF